MSLDPTRRALLAIRELKQRVQELEAATGGDERAHEPIAIVSVGCRFPGRAESPEAFWQLLRDGVDAVGPVPRDRWDNDAWFDSAARIDPAAASETSVASSRLYTREGAFLDDVAGFDAAFFGISPREAEHMDPQQRLLLETAWEALERAGWAAPETRRQTGVFVGSMWSEYSADAMQRVSDIDAYVATGSAGSFLAGRLSYQLGLQGPSIPVDTACSSSLVAVHLACQSLRRGECERALAAGVNVMVSPKTTVLMCQLQALSPAGRCRTFDESADGYGRGEGCGVVALRRLSDAVRDGDSVLAVIRGSAVNHNGSNSGLTVPNGPAQTAVIRAALRDAGIEPRQVSYVEAHGTGTRLGDPVELRALWAALRERRESSDRLLIGTVKTNVGHLEGAAGIAGLIKTVLSLQHGVLPPHLHLNSLNPEIAREQLPIEIPTCEVDWPVASEHRFAGVSSFGLSGINCHVVLGAPPVATAAESRRPAEPPRAKAASQLLVLSAQSDAALRALAGRYADWFEANPDTDLQAVCHAAAIGREHFRQRLAIVIPSDGRAAGWVSDSTSRRTAVGTESQPASSGSAAATTVSVVEQLRCVAGDESEWNPAAAQGGQIAWLFPGQGSQLPGMARELYESQPVCRQVLDDCDAVLRELRGQSLLDVLWDESLVDSVSGQRLLDQTLWTQPALFAVEVALAELWLSCGIEPDLVAGHSVGQYAAASVAGVFDRETGLRLIERRASLMQELGSGRGSSDRGVMVAVFASAADVEAVLVGRNDVSVAAFNGRHTVVTGCSSGVEAVIRELDDRDVRCVPLNTSHAFHSAILDPILDEFEQFATTLTFRPVQRPLVCNLSGRPVDLDQTLNAAYWRRHARHAVQWERTVASLAEAGSTTLLEVGPQAVLTGMTSACWPSGGRTPQCLTTLPTLRQRAGGTSEQAAFLTAMGALFVAGRTPDFTAVFRERPQFRPVLPTYPFQRQRYWKDPLALLPDDAPATVADGVSRTADQTAEGAHVDDLLYEVAWRRRARRAIPATFVATPAAVVEQAARSFEQRQDVELLRRYPAALDDLAELCRHLIQRSLARLGDQWLSATEDQLEAFADECGIANDYRRRWLRRLLEITRSSNVASEGDSEPATEVERLKAAHEFACIEIELVERCGQALPEVLTGQVDPLSLLFPETGNSAEDYYRTSVAALAAGDQVRGIVAGLLADLPEWRKLRVLEVGAGTGATTSAVLPQFPADRTEYHFTDLSAGFFSDARQRFADSEFLQCRRLDIEGDPVEQGFAAHSYDLVLASNVLHATSDAEAASRNVRRLLAPGGAFVMLEATAPEPWLDLTFGMLPGWWNFRDRWRTHAFLAAEDWTKLLAECGFSSVNVLKPLGSERQAVILAIADESQTAGRVDVVRDSEAQVGSLIPCEAFDRERTQLVDLSALALPSELSEAGFEQLENVVVGVLQRLRQISELPSQQRPRLWLVTRCAQRVDASDQVEPLQAVLWGLARVIALEHPDEFGGVVDLSADKAAEINRLSDAAAVGQRLSSVLHDASGEDQFVLRDDWLYVPRLVSSVQEDRSDATVEVSPDAAYLVTGGLGKLGLQTARWLVERGARTLVLVSRRGLPEDLQSGIDSDEKERIDAVQQLRARGVDVRVLAADVADSESLTEAWQTLIDLPPVRGVVHAAGVSTVAPLAELTAEQMHAVFASKVRGAWHLHRLLADAPLDFFVLYSSASSVWGGAGQGHYAAANAFLDGLCDLRRTQGLPALSINWARWPIGLPTLEHHQAMERIGVREFSVHEGLSVLETLLAAESAVSSSRHAVVARVDWSRFRAVYEARRKRPFLSEIVTARQLELPDDDPPPTSSGKLLSRVTERPAPERLESLIAELQQAVAETLHMAEPPSPDVGFFDLGMDSLMAVELRNRLQAELQLTEALSSTIVFDYPSIDALAVELLRLIQGDPRALVAGRRESGLTVGTHEPIAIIGMGCRFPQAASLDEFWSLLERGGDTIRPVPPGRWDDTSTASRIPAGFLDGIDLFDPLFFGISPREAVAMDPQHRLLLEVVWEAILNAGIDPKSLRGESVGTFVGIVSTEYGQLLRRSVEDVSMHAVTGAPLNAAAGRVAYTLGLTGPALAIDTACSSSLTAIHQACLNLQSGDCDMALAGGVNLIVSPDSVEAFAGANLLSIDGRSRAFDAAADGFGRGEGCGVVVLKRLSDAQRDDDEVLAVIAGSAVNQDGASSGLTVPNGPAQERVIQAALDRAKTEPAEIGYLECHGTGTSLGDPIEVQAVAAVLGAGRDADHPLKLGSVKSNIGHLESAAGVAGVIKTVLAMRHGRIPASLHFETPNPHIPWSRLPVEVVSRAESWPTSADGVPLPAGVSAFGVTGTNAHVVLSLPSESTSLDEQRAAFRNSPPVYHRKRYWVQTRSDEAGNGPSAMLPGTRTELANGDVIHTARLSLTAHPWVGDHRLYGAIALPGATHVALALMATGCPAHVRDVVFRSPVLLNESDEVLLQTVLSAAADLQSGRTFDVYSRKTTQAEWTLHASGVIHGDHRHEIPTVAGFAGIQSSGVLNSCESSYVERGLESLSVEKFFATYASLELQLGPALRGIDALWIGDGEAVARIVVPDGLLSGPCMPIHPAVLDACTQVAGAALWRKAAGRTFFAPLQYGEFRLLRAVPDQFFCSCRLTSDVSPEAETCSFDFELHDEAGELVGAISNFTIKRAPREAFLRGLVERPSDPLTDWFYSVEWEPALRGDTSRHSDDAGETFAWPDGVALQNIVQPQIEELVREAGVGEAALQAYAEQERLSVELIRAAFDALGVPSGATDAAAVCAESGIDVRFARLVARLLKVLDGNVDQSSAPDVAELIERYPHAVNEFTLLARCGASLADVLRGYVDPLGLLFPAEGISAADLYRDAPALQLISRVVARAVAAAITDYPNDRPLRVLEIGAGTGATTVEVLPTLPADRTEYVYTDVSPSFFAPAEERLRGLAARLGHELPDVRFETLDIEKSPQSQGFEPNRFDLVIAANVIHATLDVEASLRHARSLLAPNGLLVLCEGLKAQTWLDLTFGLLDGWWRFDDQVRSDYPLLDEPGWTVLLERLQFRDVLTLKPEGRDEQGVIVARGPEPVQNAEGDWLLVGQTSSPLLESLQGQLRVRGGDCMAMRDIDAALAELSARSWRGVVCVVPEPVSSHHDVPGCVKPVVAQALRLIQQLVRGGDGLPVSGVTWLVESSGPTMTSPSPERRIRPMRLAACLISLARVAAAEHPELAFRVVDLQSETKPRSNDAAVSAVTDLLTGSGAAGVVANEAGLVWNGQSWHRARLRRNADLDRIEVPDSAAYRLAVGADATLDGLHIEEIELSAPAAGQVEVQIRAAGLNFRDVLTALGMYPGEAGGLGGEFCGVVTQLGDDVSEFAVGDEVFGFGAGVIGSRAVVDVRQIVRRPRSLSVVAAAAVPISFVTSQLAFEMAQLRAGDRVLIHSAAGGVGVAAVQLAKAAGAIVFATASLPKHDFVGGLGVGHVYNSRTTDFAQEVLADTDGRGVDVVLNSLTGDGFVDASLRCLANGGRFVEISKRGIWSAEQVADIRPDVEYSVLALDRQMLDVEADNELPLAARLQKLVSQFDAGELSPPPVTAFPLGEARIAFRRMQAAQHVGRLVLTLPPVSGSNVDSPGTILITGGTRGLGLATAQWLVKHGARHLVLNSRSEPDEDALAAIEQLRQSGAVVRVLTGDVSERAAVQQLLDEIDAEGPPLTGIIHSAGVLSDATLLNQDEATFDAVLRPKVDGAWWLHELTRDRPIDLFVTFSSTASLIANPGQANHAVANAFLDALADLRREAGLPSFNVNWGPWTDIGAAARRDGELVEKLKSRGVGWITPDQGLTALERILRQGETQSVVVPLDWNTIARTERGLPEMVRDLAARDTRGSSSRRGSTATQRGGEGSVDQQLVGRLQGADAEQRRTALREHIALEVQRALRLDEPPSSGQRLADLGMDSLMSVELRNRLQMQLGPAVAALPTTLAFDHPTVEALAEFVGSQLVETELAATTAEVEHPAGRAVSTNQPPERDRFPLAIEQRALTFAGLSLTLPVYNVPFRIDVRGSVDRGALSKSFARLIVRHEMLRTVFSPDGRTQQVVEQVVGAIDFVDLSRASGDQAEQLNEVLAEAVSRPFDLQQAPLIRLSAVRLASDHTVLILVLHHLLTDGPSVKLVTGDLLHGLAESQAPEALGSDAPRRAFRDYVIEQQRSVTSERIDLAARYWKTLLDDVPDLDLRSRGDAEAREDEAGFVPLLLDAELVEPFERACAARDATLFMGVMAALFRVVSRRLQSHDLVMRTSEARRPAGYERTVGPFMKTLMFRFRPASEAATLLVEHVRDVTLDVYRHSDVPLHAVIEQLGTDERQRLRRNVQVTFNMQSPVSSGSQPQEIRVEDLRRFRGSSEYVIVLDLTPVDGALKGYFVYRRRIFSDDDARQMASELQAEVLQLTTELTDAAAMLRDAPASRIDDTLNHDGSSNGNGHMTRDEILECLLQRVREVEPDLADRPLSDADSLRQLGLDSMQRVEILLMTMEALEIDVPRAELNQPQNIGELVDLFRRKREALS